MRTVLSPVDLAFEAGYRAYEAGTHRFENPYSSNQSALRTAWFEGWDRGQECNGTCNE